MQTASGTLEPRNMCSLRITSGQISGVVQIRSIISGQMSDIVNMINAMKLIEGLYGSVFAVKCCAGALRQKVRNVLRFRMSLLVCERQLLWARTSDFTLLL